MITGDFVQLATAGAIKTQTVYQDIENINNYKMVALYCNYSSGYYCNPFICSVELFKTMTWIASDRRDNNQNYSAMLHYESDFVLFLKAKKDAGNPVVLYYNLSEPIERNLTQSEIQAYQNLVTYAGTTIVENDAECYMEVSAGGGDSLRAKKLALILGD